MGSEVDQGSMNQEAQEGTRESLAAAEEAMRSAADQLSEGGRSSGAASSQREAIDALREALRSAAEGVEPQTEEQRQLAEALAQRQQEIREKLLELAQRNEERDSPLPQPNIEKAAESAGLAEQSLSQGKLDSAQSQEERTEQEIRDALKALEEEEDQYQRLRQEELLFQMAEEVDEMLEMLREQTRATVAINASRVGRTRLSRSDRVRLRNVSREIGVIRQRASGVREAIEEEGVLVFTEVMRNVETDLGRIARDMGEAGGHQSGDRILALQADVETSLQWLADALKDEMERRQQPPKPPADMPAPPPPLVPDVAELKLLPQLEVELLEHLRHPLELNPDLPANAADLDPLLLEDLSRLAYKHNRVAELFTLFRKKLGVPDAAGEQHPGESHDDGQE